VLTILMDVVYFGIVVLAFFSFLWLRPLPDLLGSMIRILRLMLLDRCAGRCADKSNLCRWAWQTLTLGRSKSAASLVSRSAARHGCLPVPIAAANAPEY
jgi:hypothetical protein